MPAFFGVDEWFEVDQFGVHLGAVAECFQDNEIKRLRTIIVGDTLSANLLALTHSLAQSVLKLVPTPMF
jgi:hypothetical protein